MELVGGTKWLHPTLFSFNSKVKYPLESLDVDNCWSTGDYHWCLSSVFSITHYSLELFTLVCTCFCHCCTPPHFVVILAIGVYRVNAPYQGQGAGLTTHTQQTWSAERLLELVQNLNKLFQPW